MEADYAMQQHCRFGRSYLRPRSQRCLPKPVPIIVNTLLQDSAVRSIATIMIYSSGELRFARAFPVILSPTNMTAIENKVLVYKVGVVYFRIA